MSKKTMSKKKGHKKVAARKPASAKAAPRMSTIGVEPLGDRIVVKPLSPEETGRTLASGIIIPDTVDKEKPEQGTVVAVGPGRRTESGALIPVGVKVGDRVMFSKYGYDELKLSGVEYVVVSENNILAVLTK